MTDLRQAAQQALDAWDDPAGMKDLCVAMDALRTALEQQQAEPSQWRDMVVVSLVREGVNKHKARELADHFAASPQQQAEPPSEWPLIKNILDEYGLQAISFVAEWKAAQQQAEPVMLNGLTESETNATASVMGLTKQTEPVAWMDREGDLYKMPEITNWAPPHTMLYTTPPQRQWVGLTDEDWAKVADMPDTFDQGVAWAAARLKERNHDR